ncbi:MAG TPA: DUF255 domain-containing protein [Candidatus Limnocylindria bacterium]|nr:DUF255 domain-containing protein [Candidatus Limnocylindria bacterium]
MTDFHFSPRPNRASEIAWRTWGDAAFAEAKAADKPVLLAISAVWCHWCHVMDETSYSDADVIRGINERYIPIRVDNDERPDVNRRYNMGGWPTTAFLTPDGEILNGATYIPPDAMRRYVEQVADVWRDKRGELASRIKELRDHEADAHAQRPGDLEPGIVGAIGALIRGQYDPEFGGFGREPKFPQPKLLRFLIDEYRRTMSDDVATMLHQTLAAMASGGMYDPLEGGFFRYSTTRAWGIPHFEKMLEDNAELLWIYSEAHRTFPSAGYDRIARDVMRWMDAVLWREDAQAFSGSQDADERYYTLDAAGRAAHGAPFVDRRVYSGWNALAASAYLAASTALGDQGAHDRAVSVMRSLGQRMWDGTALAHVDRGDGPELRGLLADHTAAITAVLDEYESGQQPNALAAAAEMAGAMRRALEDPVNGGFWDAPQRDAPGRLALREKPIEDGAAAAELLLRLAALTGDAGWRESALRALRGFVGEYRQWGQFAAAFGSAVARALGEPRVVVIVGPADDPVATALWQVALRSDDPNAARQWLVPGQDDERLAARGYPAERVAAYVCVGTVCSAPITAAADLAAELARVRRRFVAD